VCESHLFDYLTKLNYFLKLFWFFFRITVKKNDKINKKSEKIIGKM